MVQAKKTIKDIERDWATFRAYALEPYGKGSRYRKTVEAWFHDLYQRHKNGEPISVAPLEVSSTSEGKYRAWSINDQMFLSHNARVLTLPHPRSSHDPEQAIQSDLLVGVWLHDFYRAGDYRSFFRAHDHTLAKLRSDIDTSELPKAPYPYRVRQTITRRVKDHPLSNITYRSAKASLRGDYKHRDTYVNQESLWRRIIIHSVSGEATVYYLGGRESDRGESRKRSKIEVTCPTGATSGHVGFYCKPQTPQILYWGIQHRAGRGVNGRSVMVFQSNKGDCIPLSNRQSPRRISPLAKSL